MGDTVQILFAIIEKAIEIDKIATISKKRGTNNGIGPKTTTKITRMQGSERGQC